MNFAPRQAHSLIPLSPAGTVTPLTITLTDAGKRFNRDWIFRKINYHFETGKMYAVTGPNGSGKSTFLQAIAGSMYLSEGSIGYDTGKEEKFPIPPENMYRYLTIAAPYIDLVEEMTAREFLHFHSQFKPLSASISVEEIFSVTGLEKAAGRQIRYFSSGMKQRLKLAQAVFSDVPVLMLDEPCTNLDADGYRLYHELINHYAADKLVIVSSNDEQEIGSCTERLNIMDYK